MAVCVLGHNLWSITTGGCPQLQPPMLMQSAILLRVKYPFTIERKARTSPGKGLLMFRGYSGFWTSFGVSTEIEIVAEPTQSEQERSGPRTPRPGPRARHGKAAEGTHICTRAHFAAFTAYTSDFTDCRDSIGEGAAGNGWLVGTDKWSAPSVGKVGRAYCTETCPLIASVTDTWR